jgi:UPF0755 protein
MSRHGRDDVPPRRTLRARPTGGQTLAADGEPARTTPPGDHHSPRRPRYGLRRALAIGALLLVVALLWFVVELFQPLHGGGGSPVSVTIARGESASQIGNELARDGVVASGFFFNLRAIIDGDRAALKAGRFTLRRGMSYSAALTALTTQAPAPAEVRVVIPEGETRRQIAALATADGLRGSYLRASRRSSLLDPISYGAPSTVRTLEGFLFPATYLIAPRSSAQTLVAEQLTAFHQRFDTIDMSYARAHQLSRYDVLIIASMVEREAQLARERPLIAAVIYNRLRLGMTLGIDATLRYALRDYTQPLTASQLANPTPYNTRLHRGLPPTPISNPGVASIDAAAHPANVPYLYYVVRPGTCGADSFATTYSQFLADVAAYNAARARNGGRSPTTCRSG